MILLTFLFLVLFLTMAQIVLVTWQLEGGGGGGGAAGDTRNSMGMQLRRHPKVLQSVANQLVEKGENAEVFTARESPSKAEIDVLPMTKHHGSGSEDFSVVAAYDDVMRNTQTTFQEFLDQERNGVIPQPIERNRPNDDDDDNFDGSTTTTGVMISQQVEQNGEVTNLESQDLDDDDVTTVDDPQQQRVERCAINLFGLPRAFASLVLPSMITNVLKQNHDYHCDYFIHYYNITNEAPGRSGAGGDIDPQEILLLEQAVAEMNIMDDTKSSSRVFFISDSEDDFQTKYETFLNMIHTAKDDQGRLLYFPWKSSSYTPTSVNNIVKMWHSIDSVWQLMEDYADQHFINYTRVAMLRSDVVYVTPVDIWVGRNQSIDTENRQVVIPGFGRHPVSDRIVYGPYDAVKEWATNRFSSLDDHVDMMLKQHPGQGMHSERYVKYNIIPRIQKLESVAGLGRPFEVVESETICFFRARADESVWIEDCDGTENIALASITQNMMNGNGSSSLGDRKALVEASLGRVCGEIHNFTRSDSTVAYLDCSTNTSSSLHVVVDDEELGKTLTRAETEAAIEEETVLGLNTSTNETFDMAAGQTTEQLEENDMVTLEEGPAGNTTHMAETDIEASEDWGEPDEEILIATM